ncbi:choice-of-anchor I domain-containing protein [Nannocystis pusilla]|uniref:choice-of-anchor I domain-containing protein n=1 Tax=Nannocystis pusilla TaxID=889268 RepID=UPI003DA60077
MYQPEAIGWFTIDGDAYLLTANEGDVRDWDGYSEEVRVKNLDLDPQLFPDADAVRRRRLGAPAVTYATSSAARRGRGPGWRASAS